MVKHKCIVGHLDKRRLSAIGDTINTDWAFFLDFDGTLVDIAPTPEMIHVPDTLPTLLWRLNLILNGALAIVSGRSVSDIECHLYPRPPVIIGAHGAEFKPKLDQTIPPALAISPIIVTAVSKLCERYEGVFAEVKNSSIAVHYRANPIVGPELEKELFHLLENRHAELKVYPCRMVHEIVPSNISKGLAVEKLLRIPPFYSRRPLVIGDDFADESAFQTAKANDGVGLKVAGEYFAIDKADFINPAEVRDWLAYFVEKFRL